MTPTRLAAHLRTARGPFDVADVKGPYHLGDLPFAEGLSRDALDDLAHALGLCAAGRASTPLILIEGRIGAGKTFLLNRFVRDAHRQRLSGPNARLVVHIPARVFKGRRFIGALAHGIELMLRDRHIPGFDRPGEPCTPLDFLAWRVARDVAGRHEQSHNEPMRYRTRRLFSRMKPLPAALATSLAADIFDGVPIPAQCGTESEAILDSLTLTTRGGRSAQRLMRMAFGASGSLFDHDRTDEELSGQIVDFVGFTQWAGLPVVFVFDQFEDFIEPGSTSRYDAVRPVVLDLLEWLREEFERWQPPENAPPFILSMPLSLSPNEIGDLFVRERLPQIRPGRHSIRHEPDLRDWTSAEALATCVIEHYWESGVPGVNRPREAMFPFGAETDTLRTLHRVSSPAADVLSPRQWLSVCRDAWMHLLDVPDGMEFDAHRRQWLAQIGHGKTSYRQPMVASATVAPPASDSADASDTVVDAPLPEVRELAKAAAAAAGPALSSGTPQVAVAPADTAGIIARMRAVAGHKAFGGRMKEEFERIARKPTRIIEEVVAPFLRTLAHESIGLLEDQPQVFPASGRLRFRMNGLWIYAGIAIRKTEAAFLKEWTSFVYDLGTLSDQWGAAPDRLLLLRAVDGPRPEQVKDVIDGAQVRLRHVTPADWRIMMLTRLVTRQWTPQLPDSIALPGDFSTCAPALRKLLTDHTNLFLHAVN